MNFATALRKHRERLGLTQAELAERLTPSHTAAAVTMWETGKAKPRYSTLLQLAEMFGVTTDQLLEPGRVVGSSAFLPLVATAHMGEFDFQEDFEGQCEVPSFVAKNHPRGFVVHGFGSCMNKRFPEDALLVIDPDMQPRNGEAVLVTDELHGSIIRSFFRGNDTLVLSADSWSDSHEDIVIRATDEPVQLRGVVVWYQSIEDVR